MQNKSMDNYVIKAIPLSDLPNYCQVEYSHSNPIGKNGPIYFYDVQPGVKVLALNEQSGELKWTDVTSWSKHPGREVEIVNLANGMQIITDNDPRAVYGVTLDNLLSGNMQYERMTPTEAYNKNLYVPVACSSIDKVDDIDEFAIDIDDINATIANEIKLQGNEDPSVGLWEAIAARNAVYFSTSGKVLLAVTAENGEWHVKHANVTDNNIDKNACIKLDETSSIQFVKISNIEYTHKKATGYDLTVPGYETFLSIDGIVLSNTMNVHVPGSSGAVQDVIEKLMPDRQIFSIRTPGDSRIVNAIKQEFLSGLYTANKRQGKLYHFPTKEAALDAIRRGLVKLNDNIEIG